MSEKTEEPTPKKLRDAKKDGQVAQSKEVVSAATLITISAAIMAFFDTMMESLKHLILLPGQLYQMPFPQALKIMVEVIFDSMVILLMPILGVVFITGILANVIQVGPMMSAKSITPELNKISPVSGFKKIFAVKNLVEFLKSIIKILLLSILIYISMRSHIADMFNLSGCGKACIMPLVGDMMMELIMYSAVAFIIIAVLDYFFEKKQHIKQLKMTKDEVKREYKESEGSPEIKGKRKQFHKELLDGPPPENVKKSSVVLANPTHVAIGLYYNKDETPLPIITVKGTDVIAQEIKAIAKEADIPVIENRLLARALLAHGEVDQYIPATFIEPVAEVLRWVQQMTEEQQDTQL